MEQSLSWKSSRFSDSQEITGLFWKPKVITAFTCAVRCRSSKPDPSKVSSNYYKSDALSNVSWYRKLLMWELVSNSPPLPLVRCPQLDIQYIRRCHSYLEAFHSTANGRRVLLWWRYLRVYLVIKKKLNKLWSILQGTGNTDMICASI
jgi:hypothetical protein